MVSSTNVQLANVLNKHEKDLLADWVKGQLTEDSAARGILTEAELGEQSREFLQCVARRNASRQPGAGRRRRVGRGAAGPEQHVAHQSAQGLRAQPDRDLHLFAEAAFVRPPASRARAGPRRAGAGNLDRQCAARQARTVHYRGLTRKAATKSSRASSRRCWSCRRPWCSCGTACWRCR